MKKNLLVLILLQFTTFNHTPLLAAPFGMEMGMPLEKAKKQLILKPSQLSGTYITSKLIKSHPRFNEYRLTFSPDTGLCRIVAWSESIYSSAYGDEVTNFFDSIKEPLEEKYGNPKVYDFLKAGSIWNDPKDWMMALYKKERTLTAYWLHPDIALPDNIQAISVETFAVDQESGLVSLTYEFKNIDKCLEWKKSKLNESL